MATVQSIAEKNNSTVIDRSVAVPNSTIRERSDRAVNEFGQTQIKGGTSLNDGFFQSIINGYSNLVNTPLALSLIILGVMGLLLESVGNQNGPLERLLAACLSKADTSSGLVKGLSLLIANIVKFLVPHKVLFFSSLMFWGPYAAKPSKNNLWISSVSTVLIALFDFPALELIAIGQLYLCYTQVRNPKYRVLLFLITVVCFFIGTELLKELHTAKPSGTMQGGGSAQPNVAPMKPPTAVHNSHGGALNDLPLVDPLVDELANTGESLKRIVRNNRAGSTTPTPTTKRGAYNR